MSPISIFAVALAMPAHALDCAGVAVGDILPADGAVDVALNARPHLEVFGQSDRMVLVLLEDGVEREDAAWEQVAEGDPEVWQLSPSTELLADTTYTLIATEDSGVDEPWTMAEQSFTTGNSTDTTAPDSLDKVYTDHEHDTSEWGPSSSLWMNMQGGDDASGTTWVLELSERGDFSDTITRVRLTAPAEVAHGWCTFDSAGELDPDTTRVRVTPVDLAGNVGNTVEQGFAESDDKAGRESRCSVVPASTFSMAGVLLGMLGLARRRR